MCLLRTNPILAKKGYERIKSGDITLASFKHHNKEYILHLFLRKERDNSNQYSPISFILKSSRDKNKEQFINKQELKVITHFSIIENPKYN